MFEIGRHGLETKYGDFVLVGHIFGDNQQVVLTAAKIPIEVHDNRPWMLRVQYGCVNATAFHAIDCDCGCQIENSLQRIQENGKGVFVYFRDHEAFGLGLAQKIKIVSEEKRRGLTFEGVLTAEERIRPKTDILWTIPTILDDLEISRSEEFVLLSANQEKFLSLQRAGVRISGSITI